ncbi:hypothetical protein DFH09DRAFT_1446785 [Mycena vulgaris]|nr:hypothetical protein DFH09DRAFT_1446785 [Mycena vulgaris]
MHRNVFLYNPHAFAGAGVRDLPSIIAATNALTEHTNGLADDPHGFTMATTRPVKPWPDLAPPKLLIEEIFYMYSLVYGQMSRYFNMPSQLGRLQFNQCQIKEPQELLRENFPFKPWLKPLALAWPGLLLALALAWKMLSQSQTKPSQSHGFRAKPSQQNTNSVPPPMSTIRIPSRTPQMASLAHVRSVATALCTPRIPSPAGTPPIRIFVPPPNKRTASLPFLRCAPVRCGCAPGERLRGHRCSSRSVGRDDGEGAGSRRRVRRGGSGGRRNARRALRGREDADYADTEMDAGDIDGFVVWDAGDLAATDDASDGSETLHESPAANDMNHNIDYGAQDARCFAATCGMYRTDAHDTTPAGYADADSAQDDAFGGGGFVAEVLRAVGAVVGGCGAGVDSWERVREQDRPAADALTRSASKRARGSDSSADGGLETESDGEDVDADAEDGDDYEDREPQRKRGVLDLVEEWDDVIRNFLLPTRTTISISESMRSPRSKLSLGRADALADVDSGEVFPSRAKAGTETTTSGFDSGLALDSGCWANSGVLIYSAALFGILEARGADGVWPLDGRTRHLLKIGLDVYLSAVYAPMPGSGATPTCAFPAWGLLCFIRRGLHLEETESTK